MGYGSGCGPSGPPCGPPCYYYGYGNVFGFGGWYQGNYLYGCSNPCADNYCKWRRGWW